MCHSLLIHLLNAQSRSRANSHSGEEYLPYSEVMYPTKNVPHTTNLVKGTAEEYSILNSLKIIYNFSFTNNKEF